MLFQLCFCLVQLTNCVYNCQGDRGMEGLPGLNGMMGDKGDLGMKGSKGLRGFEGPQGNPGVSWHSFMIIVLFENFTIPTMIYQIAAWEY